MQNMEKKHYYNKLISVTNVAETQFQLHQTHLILTNDHMLVQTRLAKQTAGKTSWKLSRIRNTNYYQHLASANNLTLSLNLHLSQHNLRVTKRQKKITNQDAHNERSPINDYKISQPRYNSVISGRRTHFDSTTSLLLNINAKSYVGKDFSST